MMVKRREGSRPNGSGKMPSGLAVGVFLFLLIGLSAIQPGSAEASLADHVVINEVSVAGASGAGGSYDDWVELYNPTAADINLSSWSMQRTDFDGDNLYRKAFTGINVRNDIIPAGGYFLIVRDNASTTQSLKDSADVLAAGSSFSLDNSIIYLVNNNVNISSSTDPDIIDFVGLGSTASFYEGGAAAPNPGIGKSIVRTPDGEDTDNNNLDFALADNPTPKVGASDDDIGGMVLLTITPDAMPAQNINSTGAQIVFQVNAVGSAKIKYGLDIGYASSTAPQAVTVNATATISLNDLACATAYHYVIYAENSGATENDTTEDAVFTTLPCGITLNSLAMTKASAKANNQYASGWQWEFNLTVWNMNETSLKMKFNQWTGAGFLSAGANMQYSVDGGSAWTSIAESSAYPILGADLTGIDNDAAAGRQVEVMVRMKVPVGTAAGYYISSYGILTE